MYRKGVSALIINNKDEFLLVTLNSFEEHFFAIPGGGLEEGESLEEAVYREIKEELGIEVEFLKFIGKGEVPLVFNFKIPKVRNGIKMIGSERHFFAFEFTGDDIEIKLQENEVNAYKWVSYSKLDKFLLFDNQFTETSNKIVELFPQFK